MSKPKMPPKPDFPVLIYHRDSMTTGFVKGITKMQFDAWYAEHIEKMFENAKHVYGRVDGDYGWFDKPQKNHPHITRDVRESTSRALLINIEPIREETAEDLLRECVEGWAKGLGIAGPMAKARAYLEKRKKD